MPARPLAVLGLAALLSHPAAAATVKVVGGEGLAPAALQMRYHVDSGLAALVAVGLHRDGYWTLVVPGHAGGELRVVIDTQKLPACGTALGLYYEDGGKGYLGNGYLDNGNLTALVQAGGQPLLLDVTKDGVGRYAGKVQELDTGKQLDASLEWTGPSMGFDTADVTVSLNGTPVAATSGTAAVYYHKDATSGLARGLKVAHAGVADAGVCYKVNTVSTFGPEALPPIVMTYSGTGTDGADAMVMIGLTDQSHIQASPRVVSAFINTAQYGIGADVFE